MEESSRVHAAAALLPSGNAPTGWAPEPVWTFWRRNDVLLGSINLRTYTGQTDNFEM